MTRKFSCLIFTLLALVSYSFAQGSGYSNVASNQAPGNLVRVIPGAAVVVCGFPGTGGTPCTNLASTFTDPTLAVACGPTSQIVPPGSSSCQGTADSAGNFGFWAASGVYTYYFLDGITWQGPFTVTLGGAGGGGGGGLQDPGSNGLVKRVALNTTAVANISDILNLFTAPVNSGCYLRGDGQCQLPPGSGVSSSANSPGPIAAYFGAAPSTQVQQDPNCTTDFSGHLACAGLSATVVSATGTGANGPIFPNAGSGTTSALLAKIVSGQLVTPTTSDTAIPVFVVMPTVLNGATTVCAAGTTGNGCIATSGQVSARTDGTGSTANHFAVLSTTIAGRIADGGTALPAGPACVVGIWAQTVAANGTGSLNAIPFCYGSGTGVADPGGNGIMARTALNTSVARTITAGTGITVTNGNGVSGNPTAAVDSTVVATTTNPIVQTNKTIDAEGTGNVLSRPFYVEYTAGCNNAAANPGAFDLPTSAAATATCFGTTTTQGVLDFVDAATSTATGHLTLPQGWSGNMDVRIFWFANAASSNAVRWSVQTGCVADAQAVSTGPSYNSASAGNTAYTGTANQRKTTAFTAIDMTNCSAGETMYFQLARVGGDAGDTLTATAEVISVQFEGRATK